MKPSEFWGITLVELIEMLEAVHEDDNDKFKLEHHLLAWQTALLMNATGNFKKPITIEKLLGKKPEEDKEVSGNGSYTRVDRDKKNKQLEELKKKFNKAT